MKRRSISTAALAASVIMLGSVSAHAQETAQFDRNTYIASMENRKILKIAMVDCVAMALKNNSDIEVKKIEPKIEDANVLTEGAKFDPIMSLDYLMEDDTDNSDNPLFGPNPTKIRTNTINLGYDQTLISGTKLALDFDTVRTRSNYSPAVQAINPVFDTYTAVTVTQPLMRGFGITVTQADFLIAQNNKRRSVQDLKTEVMRILTDVKKAYYDYQYSREQYNTAAVSLQRVQDLHDINKEKYAKGLASNVDLLQSESETARFEQALAAAEGDMKLAEDTLKYITNLVNDEELWNADIELIGDISYEEKKVNIIDSLEKSFGHRPDYEAAKIDLKSRDISVIYYKNGLLPVVDLVGSYGFNGLAKNFEKDMGVLGSGMYQDWAIGVGVSMPLGNDEAKGKYRRSQFEKQQALILFKRLEQKIILEVRNAVRDVDIKYRMLEASIKNRDAEVKNYEAQSARFRAGLVSTHDIIDYQEKLARAEVNYAASVIGYDKSLIELAKAEGMMLDYDNIKIEDSGRIL
ncbi:MAG: TolC family protein [Candidatus Omnitrophota bacterium]